jgi:serine/threonine-protein kinase
VPRPTLTSADPAGWSRLDALLDAALARPAAERAAFLDQACQGDAALRARLDALLDIAEREDDELRPGGGLDGRLAREVLDDLAGADEITLAPGSRLGRFEVRGLLGRGGMGRVYRAHDPALGREVAIKALADAFRSDPDALRRFEREARVLAGIAHPNVAAIHGLEQVEGAPYLVLELVEGDTLEQRLRRGPLPWPAAVDVARQIAEGLEEAHRKGVVHRDLKPANVKLAGDGRVKLLDFGLARSVPVQSEAAALDATSVTATLPGKVVGTAPYMSPEQARGLAVDARTDVWALGCVLYEMLSGRRAFSGATVTDVLAAIVREDPDWSALPSDTPPALRRLVERCLRRDVRQRLQDVGDVRLELTELPGAERPDRAVPGRGPALRRALQALPWLAVIALAVLVAVRQWPGAAGTSSRALQLAVTTPPGIDLADDFAAPFALSPDGSTLVFLGVDAAGVKRLYARSLDAPEARPLAGSEGAWQPFFSPDGRWVGFFADGRIKKMGLAEGPPLPVAELGGRPRGASWGSDGTIVVAPSESSGLWRVSAEGGRLIELTRPDPARRERTHRWPQVLPGGHAVLFTVGYEGDSFEDASVEVLALKTGERRRVIHGAGQARLLADGHLVFVRGGRLFAQRFDAEELRTVGDPVTVLDGVRHNPTGGGTHVALADNGTLAYVPGLPSSPQRQLAWVTLDGTRTIVPGPARQFREPSLDRRGERIALRVGPADEAEVWIHDVRSATLAQLTFGLHAARPIWTPDGTRVTVAVEGGGRWRLLSVPVAGGDAFVLREGPNRMEAGDWSPDGRVLLYQELRPGWGWELAALELDRSGTAHDAPAPIPATPANETRPRLSPDGRWLAYESDELDGLVRVNVAPFRRPGSRVTIGRPAGRWHVWSANRELLYWEPFPSRMRHVVGREEAGAFKVVSDEDLWPPPGPDGTRSPTPPFDYDARSRRLMYLERARPDATPPPYRITLFVGFGDEARRRLEASAR